MLNRLIAPPVNPVEDITLPPLKIESLANGARLHVLSGGTQPIVRLELIFKAGKWYEPQPGISHLTAKMLTEGTQSYTAKQIADTVAFYGASLECHNGFDRSTITLYCLSKFYRQLLPLIKEVALAPTFPEAEFQLLLQRTIQNISIERKRTSYIATETFTNLIYGHGHPYATGLKEETLKTISVSDLKQFHQSTYNLSNCEIFLTGEVEDLLEETKQTFSDETTFGDITITDPSFPKIKQTGPIFAEMPESLQASIRVGTPVINRGHPDYFNLVILNEILGGYFGSRLMKNIREEKGYTYGVYSTISAKEKDALFYIATDVNYEAAPDTLSEIAKEIKKLQQEHIPQDELETVQNYMIGKFLNSITSPFEQTDKYKNIILFNLSETYYTNYIQAIRTATAKELKAIANTYFNANLLEIVAGKRPE